MKAGNAEEAEEKKSQVEGINKIAGCAEEDLNKVWQLRGICVFLALVRTRSPFAQLVRTTSMWSKRCHSLPSNEVLILEPPYVCFAP